MVADRFDESGRRARTQQRLDNRRFRKPWIFEGGLPDPRFFVGQQSGGHHGGRAARQRNAFSQSNRSDAGDQDLIGHTLQIGCNRGHQRKLHEIERIEFANQPQREAAWNVWMSSEGNPNLARFHDRGIPADLLDNLARQVAVLQDRKGEIGRKSVAGFDVVRCIAAIRLQRAGRLGRIVCFRIHAGLRSWVAFNNPKHSNEIESQKRPAPRDAALRAMRSAPSTGSTTCGLTSALGSNARSSL